MTYAYDPWYPRLTSQVDGTGTTTITYHPDAAATNGAGQIALINGPVANDTQKHTYDQLGRLKKLAIVDDATQTTPSYTEEWTFDARSRPTTVQNNLGSTTYAFMGQSDRPATASYPSGMQTVYDYFGTSGDLRVKQIKNLSAGPTPTVISQFDYTYRQDRGIDTWKVEQGSGATTWTFGYDGARQLTSATRRDATPTIVEALSYGYDKAGNRIQVGSGTTAPTAPRNFEVNSLNQLLTERDHGRTTFAGTVNEPATVKGVWTTHGAWLAAPSSRRPANALQRCTQQAFGARLPELFVAAQVGEHGADLSLAEAELSKRREDFAVRIDRTRREVPSVGGAIGVAKASALGAGFDEELAAVSGSMMRGAQGQ